LSWNGPVWYTITSPQATGQFAVSDLLDPNGSSASFQIVATAYVPPPIPAPITPPSTPSSPSPVTATVLPNHSVYESGQTIRLSMTLKNTSSAKVKVAPKRGVDGITVMEGSTVVFRSRRIASALAAQSIKPHSSIELALNWSGRPTRSGIKRLTPGTYTVQVVEGGYSGTATIRVVGRGQRPK